MDAWRAAAALILAFALVFMVDGCMRIVGLNGLL